MARTRASKAQSPSSAQAPAPRPVKKSVLPKVLRTRARTPAKHRGKIYRVEDERMYGIRASMSAPSATGQLVQTAMCLFCHSFGREPKILPPSTSIDALVSQTRKPRATTSTTKFFTTFRTDQYVQHHERNHPEQWIKYKRVRHDAAQAKAFFGQRTITSYLPTNDGYNYFISPGVYESIKNIFCNSNQRGTNVFQQLTIVDTSLPEDLGPLAETDTSIGTTPKYKLLIRNEKQFRMVVHGLSLGSSFRSLAECMSGWMDIAGCTYMGKPSQKDIGNYVRQLVAINFSGIEKLLSTCWCFSVGVDGASHKSEGYLDVRICFPIHGDIVNVHAVAIPMGKEAHTGANYAAAVIAYINYLCPNGLSKLMGITTDGAANMTGCAKGFNKILSDAAVNAGSPSRPYVVWCLLHRANLCVGKMLDVLDIDYNFRSKLSGLVAFVRKHPNLHSDIGYAATFSETRWSSISTTCSWLAKRRTEIVEFACSVGKEDVMPEPEWWLCLYAMESITDKICTAFKKMQYETITPGVQLKVLRNVRSTLLPASQKQDALSAAVVFCDTKIEHIIVGEDVDAWTTFNLTPEVKKTTLLKTVAKAIDVFCSGIEIICTEATGVPMLPQTPFELVTGDLDVFMGGVHKNMTQLKNFGGADMLKAITRERSKLVGSYASDVSVQKDINGNKGATLALAWASFVNKYPNLSTYCAGLATVLPATHTVESDFSVLKSTKDDNRSAISNYAMEGQMQAKQFERISAAVTSARLAFDRIRNSNVAVVT